VLIPRVKICGITREEDALSAWQAGADAIGIVFYPPSSRFVGDLGKARAIAQVVGPFLNVYGLFVNASEKSIVNTLDNVPLTGLQFHGDETEQECVQYRRPYVKALRMKDGMDVHERISNFSSAAGVLLDTFVDGVRGGTGRTFDWKRFPQKSTRPLILAGGLNEENVAKAVAATRPYAVDVSGGVEDASGVKNKEKIFQFITQVKSESQRECKT